MRDRIFAYLRNAGEPVSAAKILGDVLQIHSSSETAAGRILESLLKDDRRFSVSGGRWLCQEGAELPSVWQAACAVLCTESACREQYVRGAILFPTGRIFHFDNEVDPEQARPEAAQLSSLPVAAWQRRDMRLWNALLRSKRLPEWQGQLLPVRDLAARALSRSRGSLTLEGLARALGLTAPGECPPDVLARFVSDCIPLLLALVPVENRRSLGSLEEWISAGGRRADFDRFDFGPEFLSEIPESPGAYIMKDRSGAAVYVGQSGNLKRRVGSYFTPSGLEDPKTARIHRHLHSIELRPAANEVEALLLEMRLIRKLRPAINLQREVHSRPGRRHRKNWLLVVCGGDARRALVYFLKEGIFTARQSVRRHCPAPATLREKIKATYYSKSHRQKRPGEWEAEIVSSWLSQNKRQLNWIDVDESGTFGTVIRRLNQYLSDPDELRHKVYYR